MKILHTGKSAFRLLRKLKSEISDNRPAGRDVNVRPDDTWLVSYPKSGNTWTRFLVANTIYKSASIDFKNIEALVPDIYQHSNYFLDGITSPRILKSHEYFDPRYRKVILIVRDPRDVAISFYYHKIKMNQISSDMPISEFIKLFLNDHSSGNWAERVGSWLGAMSESESFLLLRYEDMLSDTKSAIRKIANFMCQNLTDSEVEIIERASSIEEMKRLEISQHDHWKPMRGSRKDMMFVRSGKSGQWCDILDESSLNDIYIKFGVQMRKLGYIY
jgi:hypothetical protein